MSLKEKTGSKEVKMLLLHKLIYTAIYTVLVLRQLFITKLSVRE